MIVSEIKLFELLKARIGEKEAEAFVQILETRVDKKFDEAKNYLATKEDLVRLEGKLETKIAETKAELIKWMFIFWIGTVSVLSGIMFAMLNAYLR
jgi:hypothetical protein